MCSIPHPGGTRVIGLVEFPLVAVSVFGGRVEEHFPISTMDILPTILDALGIPAERYGHEELGQEASR